MPNRIDITGQRFGRLIAIAFSRKQSGRQALWLCRCDCGFEKEIRLTVLRNGAIQDCGCVWKANVARAATKHGMAHRPEYEAWVNMKQRCTNPKSARYGRYGGRGITYDPRWESFEAFYEDMGPKPEPRLTLERMDNDGPYAPWNCKWATYKEQAENRHISRSVDGTFAAKSSN